MPRTSRGDRRGALHYLKTGEVLEADLKISKSNWGGATRVGDINPEEGPYKSEIAQQRILFFLTHLGGDDSHSRAFDEVITVMGMLERRLAQGQQLGEDMMRTAWAK